MKILGSKTHTTLRSDWIPVIRWCSALYIHLHQFVLKQIISIFYLTSKNCEQLSYEDWVIVKVNVVGNKSKSSLQ